MIPELVVKLRPVTFATLTAVPGLAASRMTGLHDLMLREGLTLRPIRPRKHVMALATLFAAKPGTPPATRLERYWTVRAERGRLEGLRGQIGALPEVEAAFIAPAPEVMQLSVVPAAAPVAATPDFTARQGYLDPAPGGIDAVYAHNLPGGRGQGVRIIDVEGDWVLDHEDLRGRTVATLTLGADPAADWQGAHDTFLQHGTAVLGEMIGADNNFGVLGIAPDAEAGVVSHMHAEQGGQASGPATAIANAADLLRAGDVMLLEMHMPGPRYSFTPRIDQLGYVAVEWWEHIFDAIKDATDAGIIVVQASGNGREDLDDPLYNTNSAGFSAAWRNPFGRQADAEADSGAVLVGAGAPPSGNFGPDRSRLDFSNHGATLDAQGWGREVASTGYGDLQSDPDQRRWYTAEFAGTSSASPIVAGALACVQGVLRARNLPPLTPAEARGLLRNTGTAQQWPAGGQAGTERIGNRPDLQALIKAALARKVPAA